MIIGWHTTEADFYPLYFNTGLAVSASVTAAGEEEGIVLPKQILRLKAGIVRKISHKVETI